MKTKLRNGCISSGSIIHIFKYTPTVQLLYKSNTLLMYIIYVMRLKFNIIPLKGWLEDYVQGPCLNFRGAHHKSEDKTSQ